MRTSSSASWPTSGSAHARGRRASSIARRSSRADAGFQTVFVGYEKTVVLTQIGALEQVEDGFFLVKLRESPVLSRGRRPGVGSWLDRGGVGRRDPPGRAVAAFRFGEDQALLFEGAGFAAGDRVKATVPWHVRFPTMANHTATHLLHKALREVLGDHVHQAGSAVRPDKLRFDFSHGQPLSHEERERVEVIVNEAIFANMPVHIFTTPIGEARTSAR